MKIALFLILLISVVLFCGCISNSSVSDSVNVTLPTITSQNPDDLYIQYIAEYGNNYSAITKPLENLKQGTNDYSTIKLTFLNVQDLSETYRAKIEPLNVSPQYESSKRYYLEYLSTIQQYSDATISAPYPENPSNQSEYQKFDFYMVSLNPQMTIAATDLQNALDSDVCKMLLNKQNFTNTLCKLDSSQKEPTITVNPSAREKVMANPATYCIGSSGYVEWRGGRAVSGIFCVDN